MSDWKKYLSKTAGPLPDLARKAYSAAKPVVGKGLSTVAEGGALGLGIGATEYIMNKKMQAMEKQLKAMEREKSASVKEAYEVQDYVGRDGKVYSSYNTNRSGVAEGWKSRGMTPVQNPDDPYSWSAEEEVTDPSQLASARNILAQRQQRETERIRPGRTARGAALGGVTGGLLGAATKRPAIALGGAALGALSGGALGYKTAGVSDGAALDQSLGALYQKYGPSLEKHAAAEFYGSLDKTQLDREALGLQFCKLAHTSGMDPWFMAVKVVKAFPSILKTAQAAPSANQELAQFYLDWANNIVKKADVIGSMVRGGRALKAGAKAALPRSSASRMAQGVKAVEGGVAPQAPQGVLGAMKGSLAETKTLQQAGGGNLRRGEALAKADPGLTQATAHPQMTGAPPAVGGAPVSEGAAIGESAPQSGLGVWGNYGRGALVLGGLGLGASSMMGDGEPQPAYNALQPGYGDVYAG